MLQGRLRRSFASLRKTFHLCASAVLAAPNRVVTYRYFLAGLNLVVLLSVSFMVVAADDGGDVCGQDQTVDPQLVSTNCRFEGKGNLVEPYGLIRPYWNPFVISGSP